MGVGHLLQRVCAVNDGSDCPGFEHFPQSIEIFGSFPGHRDNHLFAAGQVGPNGAHHVAELGGGLKIGAVGGQRLFAAGIGAFANGIENHVVRFE